MSSHDAVLLVAHGTVSSNSELPEFVRKIRRGRPAPPDLISELEKRYQAIGGSPLMHITEAQAARLSESLNLPCYVAMRLWHPLVEDVLLKLAADGIGRAVLLPLAPFSVSVYVNAARQSAAQIGSEIELVGVQPWGQSEGFIRAYSEHIRRHLPSVPTELILTAHSLPNQVIQMGDRYAEEVSQCALAVARELGMPAQLAYQSQGADGGDWLGPDLRQVMGQAKSRGARHVTIAPIGFLADHVETLYDLDVEARGWSDELALGMTRVPAVNTEPEFIEALAEVVKQALS